MNNSQLRLSSYHMDQSSSVSTGDYTLLFPSGLKVPRRWSLIQATIPNVAYNITTSNNVLDYICGGVWGMITIPVGLYNESTLLSEMVTLLEASSGAQWTATASYTTNCITVTCAQAFQLLFRSGPNASPMNNLWKLLGMSDGVNPIDTTIGTSFTSITSYNFTYPFSFSILLSINGQTAGSIITNSYQQTISFSLPNITAPGYLASYTFDQIHQYIYCPEDVITKIRVQLLDDTMSVIDLHGASWELLIECY